MHSKYTENAQQIYVANVANIANVSNVSNVSNEANVTNEENVANVANEANMGNVAFSFIFFQLCLAPLIPNSFQETQHERA